MTQETTHRYYLPPLDGLRFLAFLMVFAWHIPFWPDNRLLANLKTHGGLGVDFFFAISAFILTTLLYTEQKVTGRINASYFYMRRCLRIVPLYYGFIFVMLLAFRDNSHWNHNDTVRLMGLLTFTDNLLDAWMGGNPFHEFQHLWTLSFEIQVYLVIPFLCLLLNPLPLYKRLWICAVIEAVAMALRWRMLGENNIGVWMFQLRRPDSILAGMVLAYYALEHPGPLRARARWLGAAAWLAATVLLGMSVVHGPIGLAPVDIRLLYLIPSVAVLFSGILFAVIRATGMPNRLLTCPPLRYLGKISYGLYVYHLCSFPLAWKILQGIGVEHSPTLLFILLSLAITVLIATLSYYAIERPFLKKKEHYAAIVSRPV